MCTKLTGELSTEVGSPGPLGATVASDGINFAVHSGAAKVSLLLFEGVADVKPARIIPMEHTGSIFHIFVKGLGHGTAYLYSAESDYQPGAGDRYNADVQLIDPDAHMLSGNKDWVAPVGYDDSDSTDPKRHMRRGVGTVSATPKCIALGASTFDWEGDKAPDTPLVETVIYEVSVRGFTGHKSCSAKFRGTYLGFIEKIPHLRKLGVTAVELMPIMAWYRKTTFKDPDTGKELENVWAYNTIVFGAPDEGLATKPGLERDELKMLVRALHKAGLEVYLDIVVNHSSEGHEYGPTISLKGLDNKVYYLLVPHELEKYFLENKAPLNYSGCGNTLNCNHPVVRELILRVLRHWVNEYHVDGFRFDLAAVLGINSDFSVSANSAIITEIAADPVLAKVKLIAEAWSCGVYLMGEFPSPWAEWCGRYRDNVRAFVRGESGQVSVLGKSITGSQDWFRNGRLPINIITAHDGFSLRDLVSYDTKRNRRNGENDKDGENNNRSWNCGYEGDLSTSNLKEDEKRAIERLRRKQIKNFLTLMLVSRGVPMIVYGDEMGRTNEGNNNIWNQLDLNNLDWNLLVEYPDLFRFACMMIAFRRSHFLGGRGHEPVFRPYRWHGVKPNQPNWADWTRFFAVELGQFAADSGVDPDHEVFIASNGHWDPIKVELPAGDWHLIVDTDLDSGKDIVEDENATKAGAVYELAPRSTIVLLRG